MTPKQKALAALLTRGRATPTRIATWSPTPGMYALLDMEMEDSGFTDYAGHTITQTGTPVRDTSRAYTGASSVLLNGTTQALMAAYDAAMSLGSADWRLRLAFFPVNRAANQDVIAHRASASTSFWLLRHNTAGTMRFFSSNAGTTRTDVTTTATTVLGAWNTIDVRRTSGVVSMSLNSNPGLTVTTNSTAAYAIASVAVQIGRGDDTSGAGAAWFPGNIDALLWERAP